MKTIIIILAITGVLVVGALTLGVAIAFAKLGKHQENELTKD